MSYEEGNLEADIAADSEYYHCDWDDPGSDFLYGVLMKESGSRKMRTAFIVLKCTPGVCPRGCILFNYKNSHELTI